MDERKPDHTDEGAGSDVGQGYPEENQPGSNPDEPGSDPSTAKTDSGGSQAPSQSSDEEGDAGQATGNPDAAG